MQSEKWLYVYRHSINELYKNADFSDRYIFDEDALDAGECLMTTRCFVFQNKPEYITILVMHGPNGFDIEYHTYLYVCDYHKISKIIYDIFDKQHQKPNTIHFDYIEYVSINNVDSVESHQCFNKEQIDCAIKTYITEPVYMQCESLFANILVPYNIGNAKDFLPKIYQNMSTVTLKFSDIYNWYNQNQSNPQLFLPCQTIQYRYIQRLNGKWVLSNNIGNVSLEMTCIQGNNKLYLQLTPDDIYVVMPTINNGVVFGNHYRIHKLLQYSPDWDRQIVKHNVIDIHKTMFSYPPAYAKHDPKCIFDENTIIPYFDTDNIICHNKIPTSGFKFFKNIFVQDKQLVQDIIGLPYMQQRNKAAKIIANAWKKFKTKGGRVTNFGKRGGLYQDNKYIKPNNSVYETKNTTIDNVHVIIIYYGNQWHYTFNIYSGEKINSYVKTYKNLDNSNIITELESS